LKSRFFDHAESSDCANDALKYRGKSAAATANAAGDG
jgi:hypothetical protein